MKKITLVLLAMIVFILPSTAQNLSANISTSEGGPCTPDDLTTSFAGGNTFAGNMFDVTASGGIDLLIEKFDVNIEPGTANISIYSRPGTYVGFEDDAAGWTLMGTEEVTSAGTGFPTEVNVGGLTIPAGETYGMYVTVTDYPSVSMNYTNTPAGTPFSDASMTIETGVGKGNPDFTGSTFADRGWNGTIHYCTTTTSSYCGPITFEFDVEPITHVEVAGIANTTSPDVSEPAHEDYSGIIGNMIQGEDYAIALEGNTNGNWENFFTVFIDWDQNGVLDDAGEVYEIGTITNSTGTDGQQATGTISVPLTATLGETRMRVFKVYEVPNGYVTDPCSLIQNFGQVEDYTIDVSEALGINDNSIAGFIFHPNPASNELNLKADAAIDNAAIYTLSGQKVMDQDLGATTSRLDVSNLASGIYLLKVVSEGQTGVYKLIKN